MAQVLPPKKTQFCEEKMLRLLEIFFLKNSSPFFLKPWRVRASNLIILLIGAIKHYNFFYCHFLLRPFLSEMFAGPFHQAKAESSSRTVCGFLMKNLKKYHHIAHLWVGVSDAFWPKSTSFVNLLCLNAKTYINETNGIQKFGISAFKCDFFIFLNLLEVF